MLQTILKHNIILPATYPKEVNEAHAEGFLADVIVELEGDHKYKLCFVDFYRLAEEFVRNWGFYRLEWFTQPGLVIVKSITPQTVREAVLALLEWDYFYNLTPISSAKATAVDASRKASGYTVTFPEWYAGHEVEVWEDKGYLDDVIVQLANGCQYSLHFEDFVSFTQRFAANARRGDVYIAKPGLIIISTINPEVMNRSVSWLVEQNYFEHLKPLTELTRATV